jgi:hypothetical protein
MGPFYMQCVRKEILHTSVLKQTHELFSFDKFDKVRHPQAYHYYPRRGKENYKVAQLSKCPTELARA